MLLEIITVHSHKNAYQIKKSNLLKGTDYFFTKNLFVQCNCLQARSEYYLLLLQEMPLSF